MRPEITLQPMDGPGPSLIVQGKMPGTWVHDGFAAVTSEALHDPSAVVFRVTERIITGYTPTGITKEVLTYEAHCFLDSLGARRYNWLVFRLSTEKGDFAIEYVRWYVNEIGSECHYGLSCWVGDGGTTVRVADVSWASPTPNARTQNNRMVLDRL